MCLATQGKLFKAKLFFCFKNTQCEGKRVRKKNARNVIDLTGSKHYSLVFAHIFMTKSSQIHKSLSVYDFITL